MMREKPKREIHGFILNGDRVFLGRISMTDDEVLGWLTGFAKSYATNEGKGSTFYVGSSIFHTAAFTGVQVTPPIGR